MKVQNYYKVTSENGVITLSNKKESFVVNESYVFYKAVKTCLKFNRILCVTTGAGNGKAPYEKIVTIEDLKKQNLYNKIFNENENENVFKSMTTKENQSLSYDESSVRKFIHEDSIKLKPKKLIISDLKWKYLIRSAVRGKNIMMTGDAGSGKTLAAKSLVIALDGPDFYFNLGSTQDARAALVGNTQFSKETGTWFSESAFVKAIKTPNAVILLDEISRAHPDAWNILMTVLDAGQRYMRLDEAEGSPIVEVAPNVTFIATANIGSEYTSTRIIDRAILDRFTIIEMDLLNATDEFGLLEMLYPNADKDDLKAISEISTHTRDVKYSENAKLTNAVSTRVSVETAGLIDDGFDLLEAAEISIFPFFSPDGGLDSERTYVKQLVQKYIKPDKKKNLFEEKDEDDSYIITF